MENTQEPIAANIEAAARELSYQMGDGSAAWRKYVDLVQRLQQLLNNTNQEPH